MHKLDRVQDSGIFDQKQLYLRSAAGMYILQPHVYLPLWGMQGFPSTVLSLLFSNINIVWALPWLRKTTFISKAVFICCLKRISFQFHYILATCYGPCKSYRLLFTQEPTYTLKERNTAFISRVGHWVVRSMIKQEKWGFKHWQHA